MSLSFVHDQFRWKADTQRFLLIEPPALFDEPPDRITVQAWRHAEGWALVYTHKFDHDGQLGIVDLWSRADES